MQQQVQRFMQAAWFAVVLFVGVVAIMIAIFAFVWGRFDLMGLFAVLALGLFFVAAPQQEGGAL